MTTTAPPGVQPMTTDVPRRLAIVPRWSGRTDSDWYPWMRAQLDRRAPGAFSPVLVGGLVEPDAPQIERCRGAMMQLLGDDPALLARTVLVGHSVGCQVVLHYLETLGEEARVAGVLCVAGWWSVDEPWDTIQPWIETPHDLPRIAAAAERFVVMLSDNDPFTADHAANAAAWRERLAAEVVLERGAEHFNRSEEPAVLDAILSRFCPGSIPSRSPR